MQRLRPRLANVRFGDRTTKHFFVFLERCNAKNNCAPQDDTDEENCSCSNGQFTCDCFKGINRTCGRSRGCIDENKRNDGRKDCHDESDEKHLISSEPAQCDECPDITLWRLNSEEGCNELGSELCDNSTCKAVFSKSCSDFKTCEKKDFLCFSPCKNKTHHSCKFFQCEDRSIIMSSRFCDGLPHCADGSDELRSKFGFFCKKSESSEFSCVLPQWNLHDDKTPQCYNNIDVCHNDECLFECFDKSMNISLEQVCDGDINCPDISDECLCRDNLYRSICNDRFPQNGLQCQDINTDCDIIQANIAQVRCRSTDDQTNQTADSGKKNCESRFGVVSDATKCDGIPECADFSDECSDDCNKDSSELPGFCSDPCSNFYCMGDRYCDGFYDSAFEYLNDSENCPKGFDEDKNFCEDRFFCKTGTPVSIPISLHDDNVRHCQDGSDEPNSLSSSTDLIDSAPIRGLIWLIALITLAGNSYVIVSTTLLLRNNKNMHEMIRVNHTLILSLAIADFMMGIYLVAISIKSLESSGFYGKIEYDWRSSRLCDAAGSLAIVSSETSVFIMTTLSTFRLINVLAPLKSLTFSAKPWYIVIGFLWLISILLAVIPTFTVFSDYFIYQTHFNASFSANKTLNVTELITIGCRYASFKNKSVDFSLSSDSWNDVLPTFEKLTNYDVKQLGYYGETGLCMPRFYVNVNGPASVYSLSIITLNFISFIYICLSYVFIYKKTSKRPISKKEVDQQNARMQKRIARLLASDFICWIPICIIAFAKANERFAIPPVLYSITVAFLLPVNSALNPLLYSPFVDSLAQTVSQCFSKKKKNPKHKKLHLA